MELNDYHYYINLEERVTRRKQCEKQLKSIGIHKPKRFNAIKNEIGLIGCAQSHIECLKIARDENWPYICIFEDDVDNGKKTSFPNALYSTGHARLQGGEQVVSKALWI